MAHLLLYELCDCIFDKACIHQEAFKLELKGAVNSHQFEAMGWVFNHILERADYV